MKDIVIKPVSKFSLFNINKLWEYRELFYVFTWRDIKVRYKQTAIGVSWVLFQPLITTLIFTLLFSKVFTVSYTKLPYPLFILCGLVFWNFFSNSLSRASNSLLENQNIIKKVYFPKIILPISAIVTSFVDFLINLIFLLSLAFIFHVAPSILLLIIVPVAAIITAMTAGGLSFTFSALNVKYRDVRYVLPFLIQVLFFITPVIYPASILPSEHKFILALNPIAGVIETIRILIGGSNEIDIALLGVSFIVAFIYLLIGLYVFAATERFFADII